jgi:ribonuclease P protein component
LGDKPLRESIQIERSGSVDVQKINLDRSRY